MSNEIKKVEKTAIETEKRVNISGQSRGCNAFSNSTIIILALHIIIPIK